MLTNEDRMSNNQEGEPMLGHKFDGTVFVEKSHEAEVSLHYTLKIWISLFSTVFWKTNNYL